MQPGDPFPMIASGCNRGNTDAGSIGSNDCFRTDNFFQLLEYFLLDIDILNNCLDHKIAICQTVKIFRNVESGDCGFPFFFFHAAFFHRAIYHRNNEVFRCRCRTVSRIENINRHPTCCGYLGDTPPHGARSDNANFQILFLWVDAHSFFHSCS